MRNVFSRATAATVQISFFGLNILFHRFFFGFRECIQVSVGRSVGTCPWLRQQSFTSFPFFLVTCEANMIGSGFKELVMLKGKRKAGLETTTSLKSEKSYTHLIVVIYNFICIIRFD